MTEFHRTPNENFDALENFPFPPNYHFWQDLRMHYVDVGPADGPVMLLVHGMPTWSYLYRTMIPLLSNAGYRCIAPDHFGFGKSDKPSDIHWYTVARHTEILTSLIVELNLKNITLVCQDWGGPIGLAQPAIMPDRFDRLIIMNTWLHNDNFNYPQNMMTWIRHWKEGGLFHRSKPNIAPLLVFGNGLMTRDEMIKSIASGEAGDLTPEAASLYKAFAAPFADMDDGAFNGLRRFPLSIPVENAHNGNAAAQTHYYRTLLQWRKPVHFIWGLEDEGFTEDWGRTWSNEMGASFDPIEGAGHFLQNSHGTQVAETIIRHSK